MLFPHPTLVAFGGLALDAVTAIAIDRVAAREIVEFSDLGPHAAFADIPEQRTHITVMRRVDYPEFAAPIPGDQAELTFIAARTRIRATCIVREVRHDLAESSRTQGAGRQTLSFIAISPDSATDPINLEPI